MATLQEFSEILHWALVQRFDTADPGRIMSRFACDRATAYRYQDIIHQFLTKCHAAGIKGRVRIVPDQAAWESDMSREMRDLCRPLQMSPSAKAVLMALADVAHADGIGFPAISTLCTYTCLSDRSVQRSIDWLKKKGLVRVQTRRGTSAIYLLTVSEHPEEIIDPPPDGDDARGDRLSENENLAPDTVSENPRQGVVNPRHRDAKPPTLCRNNAFNLLGTQSERERPRAHEALATRLPASWQPSQVELEWARYHRPDLNPIEEAEKFRGYWSHATGSRSWKVQWDEAWKNWITRADPPRAIPNRRQEASSQTLRAIQVLEDAEHGIVDKSRDIHRAKTPGDNTP